jgi:hypothetical protein
MAVLHQSAMGRALRGSVRGQQRAEKAAGMRAGLYAYLCAGRISRSLRFSELLCHVQRFGTCFAPSFEYDIFDCPGFIIETGY